MIQYIHKYMYIEDRTKIIIFFLISPNTGIRAFANCHSDCSLTDKTDEFIQSHIDDVVQSKEFLKLPTVQVDIIGEFHSSLDLYSFTQSKNYPDGNLDCDPEYPFAWDIHCSIQQSTSHCCSLFRHCYIAIHLIPGLKLSRLCVYMGQNFTI